MLLRAFLRPLTRNMSCTKSVSPAKGVYGKGVYGSATKSKYNSLPKVELHVHADGACRLKTLQDLSRKHGCPYPHDDLEEFRGVVSLLQPVSSLTEFLSVFDALGNILSTKDSLERIAYEFCEDFAAEGGVYAEYRFNPFQTSPCRGEDFCEAIFAGLSRGQKDFGVKVRCILCFLRHLPEDVMDVVRLCGKYKGRGVVGVDIAGDELLPLDARHVEGFLRAKELGMHVTVHAAESGPAANVLEAVEKLGAERIGHGYHVLDDKEVYTFAKDKGLHFEEHAIQVFAEDGVSFSLNTDDPGVINCSLTGEYDIAEQKIGLSQHQIMRSVLNGAKAAFLPADEKTDLIATIREKLVKFDPTFKP